MKFIFFGSSELSINVLEELKKFGLLPTFIVTIPDSPKGRKLILTPNIVKIWAQENKIDYIDPKSLKDEEVLEKLKSIPADLFLVASYGKIIPKNVFNIPKYRTLNIHPSLLPRHRGASPIQSQILSDDKDIGVSIIKIDELMDHGPILIQKKILIEKWPIGRIELERILAVEGAILFKEIYQDWIGQKIMTKIQDESQVTVCNKIKKEYGEIDLNDNPYNNLLKIKAFEGWPGTYFFVNRNTKKTRVLIKDAKIEEGKLKITSVLPEGKKEMTYEDFERGFRE